MTDVLASLLGVSMVISSGTAKSVGLYVMDTWQVSEFWMPALIGAVALPLLALLGYALNRLPQPTEEDIALKSERETLNGRQRWELFKHFMPFLTMLFVANIAIVVLRDIKEDFLVNIIDMSGYSPWLFTQIDSVVTLTILAIFGLMVLVKDNFKALSVLYGLINLPDNFLRSLHRLFQDTGKRRFLYCLNRFSGVHGYDTGIGTKGIRGYEIGLGGIL